MTCNIENMHWAIQAPQQILSIATNPVQFDEGWLCWSYFSSCTKLRDSSLIRQWFKPTMQWSWGLLSQCQPQSILPMLCASNLLLALKCAGEISAYSGLCSVLQIMISTLDWRVQPLQLTNCIECGQPAKIGHDFAIARWHPSACRPSLWRFWKIVPEDW